MYVVNAMVPPPASHSLIPTQCLDTHDVNITSICTPRVYGQQQGGLNQAATVTIPSYIFFVIYLTVLLSISIL